MKNKRIVIVFDNLNKFEVLIFLAKQVQHKQCPYQNVTELSWF